jgi:hypothetical protein
MAKRKMSTFERLQSGRLNRAERKELGRRLNSSDPNLKIVHADAAGIEVGNGSHFVAVPGGRDEQPIREFGSWTEDLRRMDLTRIDGLTAQVILSEVGTDLRVFADENHFASWLELASRRNVSGGKVIRQKARDSNNKIANALRMSAQALSRSDSYLGARYRRLRGRMDGKKAVKAMARCLACLVYRLITKGQAYVDRGAAYFEGKRSERPFEFSSPGRECSIL